MKGINKVREMYARGLQPFVKETCQSQYHFEGRDKDRMVHMIVYDIHGNAE